MKAIHQAKVEKLSSKFWFANMGMLGTLKYEETLFLVLTSKYKKEEFSYVIFLTLKYFIIYLELFKSNQNKFYESCIRNHIKCLYILITKHKFKNTKMAVFDEFIQILQSLINSTQTLSYSRKILPVLEHIKILTRPILINAYSRICKKPIFIQALHNFGYKRNKTCIVSLRYLINSSDVYYKPLSNLRKSVIESINSNSFCKMSITNIVVDEEENSDHIQKYIVMDVVFDIYVGKLVTFIEIMSQLVSNVDKSLSLPNADKVTVLLDSKNYFILKDVAYKDLMKISYFSLSSLFINEYVTGLGIIEKLSSDLEFDCNDVYQESGEKSELELNYYSINYNKIAENTVHENNEFLDKENESNIKVSTCSLFSEIGKIETMTEVYDSLVLSQNNIFKYQQKINRKKILKIDINKPVKPKITLNTNNTEKRYESSSNELCAKSILSSNFSFNPDKSSDGLSKEKSLYIDKQTRYFQYVQNEIESNKENRTNFTFKSKIATDSNTDQTGDRNIDAINKKFQKLLTRPAFHYNEIGIVNHKIRKFLRCETNPVEEDEIWPFIYEKLSNKFKSNCVSYPYTTNNTIYLKCKQPFYHYPYQQRNCQNTCKTIRKFVLNNFQKWDKTVFTKFRPVNFSSMKLIDDFKRISHVKTPLNKVKVSHRLSHRDSISLHATNCNNYSNLVKRVSSIEEFAKHFSAECTASNANEAFEEYFNTPLFKLNSLGKLNHQIRKYILRCDTHKNVSDKENPFQLVSIPSHTRMRHLNSIHADSFNKRFNYDSNNPKNLKNTLSKMHNNVQEMSKKRLSQFSSGSNNKKLNRNQKPGGGITLMHNQNFSVKYRLDHLKRDLSFSEVSLGDVIFYHGEMYHNDGKGNYLNNLGDLLGRGLRVDMDGNIIDFTGKVIGAADENKEPIFINGEAYYDDNKGNFFDKHGHLLGHGLRNDGKGNYYDSNGKLLGQGSASNGKGIYCNGNRVFNDGRGNFYNENGKFIGKNLYVDESGNIVDGVTHKKLGKGNYYDMNGIFTDGNENFYDRKGKKIHLDNIHKDSNGYYYDDKGNFLGKANMISNKDLEKLQEANHATSDIYIDEHGKFYDENGNEILDKGIVQDKTGRIFDSKGKYLGKHKYINSSQLNKIRSESKLVKSLFYDDKGNLYDERGRIVNSNSIHKDYEGNYYDVNGNLLGKSIFATEDRLKLLQKNSGVGKQYYLDEQGNFYDENGNPLPNVKSGDRLNTYLDEDGNEIDNILFLSAGQLKKLQKTNRIQPNLYYDAEGNLYDSNGRHLKEKGVTKDKHGNFYDSASNFIGVGELVTPEFFAKIKGKVYYDNDGNLYDEYGMNIKDLGVVKDEKNHFYDANGNFIGIGELVNNIQLSNFQNSLFDPSIPMYMESNGNLYNEKGIKVNGMGISLDSDGYFIDFNGKRMGKPRLISKEELEALRRRHGIKPIIYFDAAGRFYDEDGRRITKQGIHCDKDNNYFDKDGKFLGFGQFIDFKNLKKLQTYNKLTAAETSRRLDLSGTGTTAKSMQTFYQKYGDWSTPFLSNLPSLQEECENHFRANCNPDLYYTHYEEKNENELSNISQFGDKYKAMYITVSMLHRDSFKIGDFLQIMNGKGVKLDILTFINDCIGKYPTRLGYLLPFNHPQAEKVNDTSFAIALTQIVFDIIILNVYCSHSYNFIFKKHIQNLTKQLNNIEGNVRKMFKLMNITGRLENLNFNTDSSIDKLRIRDMVEDLLSTHDVLYKSRCCTFQHLRHDGIRVLYTAMKIPQKLSTSEPFLRLPGDRRLKKVEIMCNCQITIRQCGEIMSDGKMNLVEVFYDFRYGNHFGCMDMLNELLGRTSQKLINTRSVVVLPTGEMWVFGDLSWIKHSTGVIVAKEKMLLLTYSSVDTASIEQE